MSTKNFVYSTTVSSGSDAGVYIWSARDNWSPTGKPNPTDAVVIGFSSNTVLDDINNLKLVSLTATAAITIGAGNELRITGSVSGEPGTGIVAAFPVHLEAGSSVIVDGSGDSGIYTMAGSDTLLSLGGQFVHASVGFDGNGAHGETLELTSATVHTTTSVSTIFDFDAADVVWFNSPEFAHATQAVISGTNLLLEDASNTVLYKIGNFQEAGAGGLNLQVAVSGAGVEIVACFGAGTRIATADGETAVEALVEGDLVATQERGQTVLRPVKWVGRRRIDLKAHPRPELAAPVQIRAGAFAEGLPARDLVLSPDHCLFIDGKLIPAKLLINGATIVQDLDCRAVQYFHVELDRHAVLLAEGLLAESYLDTGNRAFFANAGMALVLHPEFQVDAGLRCWDDACAKLAVDEATVGPIWSVLAERAAMLGHVLPAAHATIDDPDLRLVANDRTIRSTLVEGDRYVFALPHGTAGVTLVSRTGLPTDLVPYSSDWRRLGVGVSRITLSRGADRIDVPVDHPTLVQGWHSPEQLGEERWRWTDGAAFLPIPATDFGIVTLTIELGRKMPYLYQASVPLAA